MIRGQLDDRKRASKTDMESNWRALRDARAARPNRPLAPQLRRAASAQMNAQEVPARKETFSAK